MRKNIHNIIRAFKTQVARSQKLGADKGVAILFSILLTSVLLLVALGISSVAFKQQIFSAEARDANKAFFAADTGIECALYLNTSGFFDNPPVSGPFSCAGNPVTYVNTPSNPTFFEFALPFDQSCAHITVEKDEIIGALHYTRIESNGYNVVQQGGNPFACITSVDNPRIVTRALRVRFENP